MRFLLALLLFAAALFGEYDTRLDNYPQARALYQEATIKKDPTAAFRLARFYEDTLKDDRQVIYWYEKSYEYGSFKAAHNLGAFYEDKLKNYSKAIEWYEKAYARGDLYKAPLALGLAYKALKDYPKAIEWYEKAYAHGDIGGATNLGYLYESVLKKTTDGIKWYRKAAKNGDGDAIKNLGNTYHDQGDNVKGAAYILAMAEYGYTRQEVFDFLKNDWKIDQETLKKAYELQLKLDIPKHYTGGID